MMQMPRDVSDDALNIKRSFIPSSDSKTILEVDYSQLELRVAAWFSRDEFLLGIYNNNQDLHRMVAAQVNKVPVEEVTKPMRQAAKSISFGALYSIGPDKLAEQISVQSGIACSSTEAAQFLQNFYNSVPGFVLWARQQKYNALNNGFVETPLGRRRRFPYLGATHEVMRQAINAPIQSLASDICLTSLIACYNMIDHRVCKPIMTVHDSIVFEVETKEFDSVLPQIIEICTNKEGLLEYRVPFDVEYKSGPTYGDLKEK
jgi:DNA polymerase-1